MKAFTSDEEFVDGLVQPRIMLILLSILHVMASVSHALNWALASGASMDFLQESVSTVATWINFFTLITLFADYLKLTDESEFRYLFERPLIWQSYAFWMLLEIILFAGATLTTVMYLVVRTFCRKNNRLPFDTRALETSTF